LLSVALLVLSGLETFAGQPLTLGSGKSVEILAVGPLQSTAGWSALMLKYRTLIPLSDVPTLRKEADEIWDRFVVDVEHAGNLTAVISANEPEKGFVVTSNSSYNFIFEKRDGLWRSPESSGRAQAKLDPDFVREFVNRIDALLQHNEMNALLLYMALGWTVTITNPTESASGPQTIDRMKFVAATHAAFAAASSHQHGREIIDIAINEGHDVAQVQSRENEVIITSDRQITGTERSTDVFELRDDVMLWTKSTSVIEKQAETKRN
jgi:hypothetical protein